MGHKSNSSYSITLKLGTHNTGVFHSIPGFTGKKIEFIQNVIFSLFTLNATILKFGQMTLIYVPKQVTRAKLKFAHFWPFPTFLW